MPNTGKVITSIEDFFTPTIGEYEFVSGKDPIESEANLFQLNSQAKASKLNLKLNAGASIFVNSETILQTATRSSKITVFNLSSSASTVHNSIANSVPTQINLSSSGELEFYTSAMPPNNKAKGEILVRSFVLPILVENKNILTVPTKVFELTPVQCKSIIYTFGSGGISDIEIFVGSSAEAEIDRSALIVEGKTFAKITTSVIVPTVDFEIEDNIIETIANINVDSVVTGAVI